MSFNDGLFAFAEKDSNVRSLVNSLLWIVIVDMSCYVFTIQELDCIGAVV